MEEPIENLYFSWLCAKVSKTMIRTPSSTYYRLFKQLHQTEFVWLVLGDDNRVEDGTDLRYSFLIETNRNPNEYFDILGCSVFEMLIAFSHRAEFLTDISYINWFWTFLDNLGLKELNDGAEFSYSEVSEILDRFVWRTYEYNGEGGICPIKDPKHDQRNRQIWLQFADYLEDNEWN